MLEISGTAEEINRIKSALWYSSNCPICSNPDKECIEKLYTTNGCDKIDSFFNCIEKNIKFITR